MAIDLYSTHFGFRAQPFSLLPDPDLLYWSKNHNRAFAVLQYGLESGAPLTVVTGEVGTGKTTLIQMLLRRVDQDLTVGLISNAQGDRGDLLRWVLGALDVPIPEHTDYVSLFQCFQSFVIDEYAAGRNVVLIIDEAQNLGEEMLEELRMLTNINSGRDVVLQIILAGQPELRDLICLPSLRQFAQRVMATCHIDPFERRDAREYIRHRLLAVGGNGSEFTTGAERYIFEVSKGIPRLINKLCNLSLVYAAAAEKPRVDLRTVREVMKDGLVIQSYTTPLLLTDPIYATGRAAE